jgi:hypothetical protein
MKVRFNATTAFAILQVAIALSVHLHAQDEDFDEYSKLNTNLGDVLDCTSQSNRKVRKLWLGSLGRGGWLQLQSAPRTGRRIHVEQFVPDKRGAQSLTGRFEL